MDNLLTFGTFRTERVKSLVSYQVIVQQWSKTQRRTLKRSIIAQESGTSDKLNARF